MRSLESRRFQDIPQPSASESESTDLAFIIQVDMCASKDFCSEIISIKFFLKIQKCHFININSPLASPTAPLQVLRLHRAF